MWNIKSAKQAINDKLQGSVATCFRYGGVVNNQVKNGLLLSVRAKFIFFKSVIIWQSCKQECGRLMHFVRLANTLLKDTAFHVFVVGVDRDFKFGTYVD